MASYEDAGVSFERAENLLEVLNSTLLDTENLGAFAAKIPLPLNLKEPILLATTDGVGTKAQLAKTKTDYYNLGIDLFAANANDILTHGVKPLSFLDYIATNKFETQNIKQILQAIQDECLKLDCSFVGGESAELPNSFTHTGVELAGFCLAIGEKKELVDSANIKAGDTVIGLKSNGFHANGFSLLRKILFDQLKLTLEDVWPSSNNNFLEKKIRDIILSPTRIYTKSILKLREIVDVNGLANVTGGGILNNLNRILPKNLFANLNIEMEQIFKDIAKLGKISNTEMAKVFNLGIGYVVIVSKKDEFLSLKILKEIGEDPVVLGKIEYAETNKETGL